MLRILVYLALMAIASGSSAQAPAIPFPGKDGANLPKRIALVIGIENYSTGGSIKLIQLPEAAKDAERMAATLERAGFEVNLLTSKTQNKPWIDFHDITAALSDLRKDAREARLDTGRGAIVAFYFAGHGLRYGEKNYLIPSHFTANDAEDVPLNSIDIENHIASVFNSDDTAPELKILIVDACRTNFPLSLNSRVLNRPVELYPNIGDISLEPTNWDLGKNHTYYIFASMPGRAAYNGSFNGDIGGEFTTRLVDAIQGELEVAKRGNVVTLNATIQKIFEKVKIGMRAMPPPRPPRTRQIPDHNDRFSSPFILFPTENEFEVEKESFDGVENIPITNFRNYAEVSRYRACEFLRLLTLFSEFSYYSPQVIQRLKSPDIDRSLRCPDDQNGAQNEGAGSLIQRNLPGPYAPSAPRGSTPSRILVPGDEGGENERHGALRHFGRVRLAQLAGPDSMRLDALIAKPTGTITFGDLKALIAQAGTVERPHGLLGDDVLLNRAVVTKSSANLRSGPGASQAVISAVAPGEFLEVVRTSSNKNWLQVRHPIVGMAFVSGDLVESALVEVTKSVQFGDGEFRPTEDSLVQLTAAFGLLGGIVATEAAVEYPKGDGKVGFARAAAVRTFVESLLSPPGNEKSRVYIHVKEVKDGGFLPHSVQVRVRGLPLNRAVRAAVAQSMKGDAALVLDIQVPTDLTTLSDSTATICVGESDCREVPKVTSRDDLEKAIQESKRIEPRVMQIEPDIKTIQNRLKILRF